MNRHTFETYVQEYCADLALKHNSFSHRQRHACVLTYNDAVISTGINVNLKHDFTNRYNSLKCLHAEAVTIMRAIQKHYHILHKCELWVCRIGKLSRYKETLFSRPCPMCQKIIKTFKIPIIHYTDDDGNWCTEII